MDCSSNHIECFFVESLYLYQFSCAIFSLYLTKVFYCKLMCSGIGKTMWKKIVCPDIVEVCFVETYYKLIPD